MKSVQVYMYENGELSEVSTGQLFKVFVSSTFAFTKCFYVILHIHVHAVPTRDKIATSRF